MLLFELDVDVEESESVSTAIGPDPNELDPPPLELSIVDYKMMEANERRDDLLAAVALATGGTDVNWEAQRSVVRAAISVSLLDGCPVMPALGAPWQFTVRPLSIQGGTAWFRLLLSCSGLKLDGRRLSPHSAKSILLFYLATFMTESAPREILGACLPKSKAVIRYSRGAVAELLRTLNQILLEIRLGVFVHDATKSGCSNRATQMESDSPNHPDVDISDDEGVLGG